MEEKITLDLNSFKALASETRVHILKKLGERRATASELATSLSISVQAASEHLEKMRAAGLVARVSREEAPPRKWVYYELTDKGRALLQPESTKKIWVLLGTSILAIAAGFSRVLFDVFSPKTTVAGSAAGAVDAIARATASVVKAAGERAVATATPFFQSLPPAPSPSSPTLAAMGLEAGGLGGEAVNQTINQTVANVSSSVMPSVASSAQPSAQLAQAGMQAAQAAQASGMVLNSFELLLIVLGALAFGAGVMLLARARRKKVI